ncbi:unnamed protein product [Rangifer tarandus platyrhynchus]|uniref:Uncharacterized protein n=1 Tax=Rangifer tarandus platyrhynchus TaxID=3082113 RepID=A0AC59Y4E0_RANTA
MQGSTEMAGGDRYWLAREPPCMLFLTPASFLVTTGYHTFPSRMWLCPRHGQSQRGVLLASSVWALWSFSPGSEGLGDNLPHPHLHGRFISTQVVCTPCPLSKGW